MSAEALDLYRLTMKVEEHVSCSLECRASFTLVGFEISE